MMLVAGGGLALNGGIMWGLRAARRHDINIRSAFVHMLGDLLGSVAIMLGALIIRYTGWMQIDPILSILIGVLIVWTAWDIIQEVAQYPAGRPAARPGTAVGDRRHVPGSRACWTCTICTSGAWDRARTR